MDLLRRVDSHISNILLSLKIAQFAPMFGKRHSPWSHVPLHSAKS